MAEVQEIRQLPAEFIEGLGKTFADLLTKAYGGTDQFAGKGLVDIDPSKFYGEKFVAGPGALTQKAEELALQGIGSYEPFLKAAAGLSDPNAYKAYMSPYQKDVIDTTLAEYDIQAQRGVPGLAASAISAGAFGGGREGVQKAVYGGESDRNRAALQANLLQQGFGQAQQLASQAFGQQMNLARTTPALAGQQISALSALGAGQQSQQQAILDAQKQLAYQTAYQPFQNVQQLGQGVMGLISGYPAQTQQTIQPSPSGLSTGLGVASTLAGIYNLINR